MLSQRHLRRDPSRNRRRQEIHAGTHFYGSGAAAVAAFGVQRALVKDARILCMSMPNLTPHLPGLMRRLSSLVSEIHFKIPIYREMKLAEANAAHEILWSGEHHGKIVLAP